MEPPSSPREVAGGELHTPVKARIRGYGEIGMGQRQISRITGVQQPTISRILRYQTSRRNRSTRTGRPPKITQDTLQRIIQSLEGHYSQRNKPWSQLASSFNLDCSGQTVARAMNKAGYHKCKACQKSYLTPWDKVRRVDFAESIQNYTMDDWAKVKFSDEIHFEVNDCNTD